MIRLTKLFLAIGFLIMQLNGSSQSSPVKFSIKQLQQDYELFMSSLKEAHPGLYRYTSKEKFDKLFSTTKSKISHSMTEEEFYRLLTPLIASIKCGHTKFHRAGRPDDRYPFRSENLFPLRLYFVNDKAYVLYSYDTAANIPAASEVIAINNKPIVSVINQLRKYITIDGDVQSALYEELNHSFNGYYATFIDDAKNYKITYKDSGKIVSRYLPAVNHEAITKRDEKNIPENKLPLRLAYTAGNIAILTIESFYADESVQKFYPFIDSVFKDLKDKNISNLIIDVRNNEGGEEDYGGYLYAYLTDKDFTYYKKLTLTKKGNYSFAKYAEMPHQLSYLRQFIKEKNGEVLFTNQQYLAVQRPKQNRFTGQVYMLINGLSFSVTTELASVVHNNKRATFVGEETGGAYYGNNSGVFAIVTLPNTKLTIGIPLVGFYSNVSGYPFKNRGIIPDYEVKSSVYDILSNKDVVMQQTLNIIAKKKPY